MLIYMYPSIKVYGSSINPCGYALSYIQVYIVTRCVMQIPVSVSAARL